MGLHGAATAVACFSIVGCIVCSQRSGQTSAFGPALPPTAVPISPVRVKRRYFLPGVSALPAGSLGSHLPSAYAPITSPVGRSTKVARSAALQVEQNKAAKFPASRKRRKERAL